MASLTKTLMRAANATMVGLYRRTQGRVGGTMRGLDVMVLTVPGRRSGAPRSSCVSYFADDGGWLVAGSANGAPRDPDWFRNLRAAGTAHVQMRAEQADVTARELTGPDYDAAWKRITTRAPAFAAYERKGKRRIPVARLERFP